MMVDDIGEVAQLAGHVAIIRAEVQDHADDPENADIRDELLETVATFERMINRLATRH